MVSNNKADPWKQQRVLKREDIPEQAHIISLAREFSDLKERALFIVAYLTAGRITEIIRLPYLRKVKWKLTTVTDKQGLEVSRVLRTATGSPVCESIEKKPLNYPGILKKNLAFTEKYGKEILVISMQNRKNPNFTRKNIPIPIGKEGELIDMLKAYTDNLTDETPLFDFGRTKAANIIGKVGMNPHFLRDIRLTHMVTIYNFNAFQLAKFAGWKNVAPAERYVRLSYSDLINNY